MKRFLSITLCVMMLASLFAVNVSAAIPTEKVVTPTSMSIIYSQTYEDATKTGFTTFYGSTQDAEKAGIKVEDADAATPNNIFVMDWPDVTYTDGVATAVPTYHLQTGMGSAKTYNLSTDIKLPSSFMVEFDANEVIGAAALAGGVRALSDGSTYFFRIHPDYANDNTWYTYRFYIDEQGGTDVTTVRANVQNTVKVFRKIRGSNEDFEALTIGKEIVYAINGTANSTLEFTISASSNTFATGMNTTKVGSSYVAAFDTVYNLDNINIYSVTKDTTSTYEINNGVYKTYDMETSNTSFTRNMSTYTYAGNENNRYFKFDASAATGTWPTNIVNEIPLTSDKETVQIPNDFAITFDACNAVLGAGLYLDIYGPGDGTNAAPKAGVNLKSSSVDKEVWYTYKICLTADPEAAAGSYMDCKIYRKPMGSNTPWTLLTNDVDYKFSGTLSSSATNRSIVRIGFCTDKTMAAYQVDSDNKKAVWYVDNLQATAACAYTGNVSVSGSTITAELNVAAATATATPIVAVYNGSTLVNAGHATVADGFVNITVENYTAGNKVMLYIWDSLANGVPVLTEALDITNKL